MDNQYIIKSTRLGLRGWIAEDLDRLTKMNKNEEVMRFFPSTQTEEQSKAAFDRFSRHFNQYGFGFFVAETLDKKDWLGFIGMQHVSFDAPFTPAIEVGYRLLPEYWGKGYATEGTKACIQYGFDHLLLDRIVSYTPKLNLPSQRVMQKSGLKFKGEFEHPLLKDDSQLKLSVLYEINK
jgi:RimJ/RimL family protein N-acetyltransferase